MSRAGKILIFVGIVIAGIIALYLFLYQDHRDISTETAEFSVSAKELIAEFQNDKDVAIQKYADKTIEITSSEIEQISDSTLLLENGAQCKFTEPVKEINEAITLKCRVIGYDELLEEVQLDGCTTFE